MLGAESDRACKNLLEKEYKWIFLILPLFELRQTTNEIVTFRLTVVTFLDGKADRQSRRQGKGGSGDIWGGDVRPRRQAVKPSNRHRSLFYAVVKSAVVLRGHQWRHRRFYAVVSSDVIKVLRGRHPWRHQRFYAVVKRDGKQFYAG